MKLIKINTDHYVVVDDSKIDYDNEPYLLIKDDYETYIHKHKGDNKPTTEHYKITHSTQSTLHDVYNQSPAKLSIQEVKELIGEVDVKKKANAFIREIGGIREQWLAYIDGYNQALEDNKDKKYTEEDLRVAIAFAYNAGKTVEKNLTDTGKEIIKYLQPKTEFEVEIVDGKLKLI